MATEAYVLCDKGGIIQKLLIGYMSAPDVADLYGEIIELASGWDSCDSLNKKYRSMIVRLISFESEPGAYISEDHFNGQHWQSVDLSSRKLKEYEEVEEMLKKCTVHNDPPKPNDILYWNKKWVAQGFVDEEHPTLHAALSSLVK